MVSKGAVDRQVGSEQIRYESVANAQVESTLLFREAYTTYAAQEVVGRLAQGFGLPLTGKQVPQAPPPLIPAKPFTSTTPSKSPQPPAAQQSIAGAGMMSGTAF